MSIGLPPTDMPIKTEYISPAPQLVDLNQSLLLQQQLQLVQQQQILQQQQQQHHVSPAVSPIPNAISPAAHRSRSLSPVPAMIVSRSRSVSPVPTEISRAPTPRSLTPGPQPTQTTAPQPIKCFTTVMKNTTKGEI